jgi:hypothetical protein
MKSHIIDELRPEAPDLDLTWESTTMRAIVEDRGPRTTMTQTGRANTLRRWALAIAVVAVLVGGVVVARDHLPQSDVRPAGPAVQTPVLTTSTPTPAPTPTYPRKT